MHYRRGLGASPPEVGQIFEKQTILDAIGSHSARVQGHLKKTRFLTFESHLKKLNCLILFLRTV